MRDRATDTPCLPCLHPDAALEITRNNVLAQQLTTIETKPGTKNCVVVAGTLQDSYTGTTIEFEKANASAVQIDHVLSAALSRSLPLSAGYCVDDMLLSAVVAL
jgi:hypothetical protein